MILFLTTSDTDILALSGAIGKMPEGLRNTQAINPLSLVQDEQAFEKFLSDTLPGADLVLLRLLGGDKALGEHFGSLEAACREGNTPMVACSGEPARDVVFERRSSTPAIVAQNSFEYLNHGGVVNIANVLRFLSDEVLGTEYGYEPPKPLASDGIYRPGSLDALSAKDYRQSHYVPEKPTAALLFYRAHWVSSNLEFVDAIVEEVEAQGCNVMPVFCSSLRENNGAVFHKYLMDGDGKAIVDVVICTQSFAMSHQPGISDSANAEVGWDIKVLEQLDVPILQAIVSTESQADWQARDIGLSPLDIAMNVALPELDGRIITVPVSFKESVASNGGGDLMSTVKRYVPDIEQIRSLASLTSRYAKLSRIPVADRKIAFVLSNYPTKASRLGNAVGLDTPASAINVLNAMKDAGYTVDGIPEDGDALMRELIERCTYDVEFLTPDQMRNAEGRVSKEVYSKQLSSFPADVQEKMTKSWGDPPGTVYTDDGHLFMAGVSFGNVFIGIQPSRGFGENPIAIYHSPEFMPTHHYVAFYRWLRDDYKADAILHLGKHGTLEWLPGKGVGLSRSCFPEVCLPDIPHFYPFIINNPGEGTQAKRRTHAVIIDHLVPAMTTADSYGDITRCEQLMDEYATAAGMDPQKLPILRQQIWEVVQKARLNEDLGVNEIPDDFDDFILHIDGYICELKDAQIRDGLHTLGEPPEGEMLTGLLLSLTRLNNGDVPGLRHAIGDALGLDYQAMMKDRAVAVNADDLPSILTTVSESEPIHSAGDVIERLEAIARNLLETSAVGGFDAEAVQGIVGSLLEKGGRVPDVLEYVCSHIRPALAQTTNEITALLRGFDGGFISPGPAGAPTRGMAGVLPTGRNFYSMDPRSLPSETSWQIGKELADSLAERYLKDEGEYPESVGISVWGTSAMRTHGDDISQILALMGVRPVWQEESRRVSGLEIMSLEELGRPRIDVTVRISGFFRDAFQNLIGLMDDAFQSVIGLEEPEDKNFILKHYNADIAEKKAEGANQEDAESESLFRIFGSKPGSYGAGILQAIDQGNWQSDEDLANVYTAWGSYAYTRQRHGVSAIKEFRRRFATIDVATKNQDNREHDIFDSDDYMQFHGGMIATVRHLAGENPRQFFGDSADPSQLKTRDLKEEARRVFRSRVVNPKWMDSMKRHGYKGAFELAATVDYIFGYDATAQIIDDWMYQEVTEAYVLDPAMQEFFKESNPWALRAIAERLMEAADRDMWENPSEETLSELRRVYLQTEAVLEERQERQVTGD
ncbi:MAG: cobaltochelatase subunit CobN [Chloroflexi bacterium]|nr:cobaltochelatase subunit CobN [Chloroflexota bacterium]